MMQNSKVNKVSLLCAYMCVCVYVCVCVCVCVCLSIYVKVAQGGGVIQKFGTVKEGSFTSLLRMSNGHLDEGYKNRWTKKISKYWFKVLDFFWSIDWAYIALKNILKL